MSVPAARIIEQRSHLVPGKLKITEHFFEVPRDYSSPSSGSLRLFARSATKHTIPAAPQAPTPSPPWLLYLQGGPGFECRSPQSYSFTNSFIERGYQVLMLDQRGTGLSSPISASSLGLRGDSKVQADYLKSFRADSIVRDCEAVRLALTEQQRSDEAEKRAPGKSEDWRKWSIIGQSFGGFCCVTYLSLFPQGLREAFITGGLPPVEKTQGPDDVYERLAKRVIKRNRAYYEKFPEDVERVKTIVRFLLAHKIRLPDEGTLTARRFLQMGLNLGFHGGIEGLHETVLRAWYDLDTIGHFTRQTADMLGRAMAFDNNMIYAILHEPIYCQGRAPKWSAERIVKNLSEFDIEATLKSSDQPVYFTGEMVFSWMLEDYTELRKVREPALALADDSKWSDLYNVSQLQKNEVPVYAAVYMDDLYVDFDLSMETASKIKGAKTLISNRIYHDGIRSKEDDVLARGLFQLRDDTID